MAVMSLELQQAVRKAETRADRLGTDLGALAACVRGAAPEEVASDAAKRQRHDFLTAAYATRDDADRAFERIIGGNELQEANYLARGALVARTVMRIVLRGAGGSVIGYGTGFLIGDGVLLTNHHVLDSAATARTSEAEALYERAATGEDLTPWRFMLEPDRLFYTSPVLDFSLVAVAARDRTGAFGRSSLGWLPLLGTPGKAMEGEWLTIIQHPGGERKQLCVRENQLIKRADDVLWYSTDTQGGSSGSPVFNNDWLLVALHHSGVPETRDGKWQTVDGRDYDPSRDGEDRIKWIANEGIRVSRIVDTLQGDAGIAAHPLVAPILATGIADVDARLPVLFAAGVALPDLLAGEGARTASHSVSRSPSTFHQPRESSMARHLTLNLLVGEDGSVSLLQGGATEAVAVAPEKKRKNVIDAPVDPARDWGKGFDPAFLGNGDLRVHLPEVIQKDLIAPLRDAYGQTFTPEQRAAGVLDYDRYSVVMNKARRFAFYSAANVSWGMRPAISGRTDVWLYDDRIAREHQVDNSYYRNNKFDRGHLTRREDMEWGSDPVTAVRRANGTCTWTNCTPQHSIFNQDKSPDPAVHLWQGLERYILEETSEQGQFDVQVFTGPVFGAGDPVYRGIAYPLEFWKVVVAVAAGGRLFATAYLLSQKDVIDQSGLEAAPAVPFGAYGTYQRPIAVIEDLAGLRFTFGEDRPLREIDPLATPGRPGPRRPRRGGVAVESFGAGPADDALTSFGDLVLF
ncbi:DNA/RNA non-specific endonuclease [Sphingomonas sp. R1]|uniref:DNA/RNA non-specific endonuclease n=1 Tax=Sphingomonas sp. R1 TaxID=399176 RepID=UPI00222514E6|nr:DNA/RNA non-specific endonuclease [Sphingomonas sp. R1]UYY78113.1 DNA/RNA non-specific endonuclease [Sphingomonas sp. R1]